MDYSTAKWVTMTAVEMLKAVGEAEVNALLSAAERGPRFEAGLAAFRNDGHAYAGALTYAAFLTALVAGNPVPVKFCVLRPHMHLRTRGMTLCSKGEQFGSTLCGKGLAVQATDANTSTTRVMLSMTTGCVIHQPTKIDTSPHVFPAGVLGGVNARKFDRDAWKIYQENGYSHTDLMDTSPSLLPIMLPYDAVIGTQFIDLSAPASYDSDTNTHDRLFKTMVSLYADNRDESSVNTICFEHASMRRASPDGHMDVPISGRTHLGAIECPKLASVISGQVQGWVGPIDSVHKI